MATLASAGEARACAVCGAGDPTLTLMGSERPFANRLRFGADLRVGGARVGTESGEYDVHEARLDLVGAWAPTPKLVLSLTAPLLRREVVPRRASSSAAFVPGDFELRVRAVIWAARAGGFRHALAGHAGVKLPTSPVQSDASGVALPPDLQPGMGAIAPLAGLGWSATRGITTLSAAATLYLPYAVRTGPHASDSFRASAGLQIQPITTIATRFAFDARVDSTGESEGRLAPSSGGFVGYVTTEALVSPLASGDLLFTIGGHFPAVQALRGDHHEGSVFSAGVVLDL